MDVQLSLFFCFFIKVDFAFRRLYCIKCTDQIQFFFYCISITVRMFCPPSTLISTTRVSWWAPGIPGMENKTRLVGLYHTHTTHRHLQCNVSVLRGLHSLQISWPVMLHIHTCASKHYYIHLYQQKGSIMRSHYCQYFRIVFFFKSHLMILL